MNQDNSVVMESDELAFTPPVGATDKQSVNGKAKTAFETQIGGYHFFPFTTRVSDSDDEKDYLYLKTNDENCREATVTLRYGTSSYDFRVAPYFANAMSRAGVGALLSSDGYRSDYSEAGTTSNNYKVRSIQQLQYINWNSETHSTATFVTNGNYMKYPYLQYTQTSAENPSAKGTQKPETIERICPRQYWRQSHDLAGRGDAFTPIAASSTNSTRQSYDAVLYTWFGGSYDGESYKVQNFNIESDSYTVGVFGVTAGAQIEDVIFYSDGSNYIRRKTKDVADAQVGERDGSYAIGGLIGIAYDYDIKNPTNVIRNCAIAGYRVEDRSTNVQTLGDGIVGGLIGGSVVRLERCSAVTDIVIDCTHDLGRGYYGSYVRVGGITGATLYAITDSYAGGSISVGDYTVNELYDNSGAITGNCAKRVDYRQNVGIFTAGIAGSASTSNFVNFNGARKPMTERQSSRTAIRT